MSGPLRSTALSSPASSSAAGSSSSSPTTSALISSAKEESMRAPHGPQPEPAARSLWSKAGRALAGLALALGVIGVATAGGYVAADRTAQPLVAQTTVLPEQFLRGFDPITVVWAADTGPGPGPADDASAFAVVKPAWPGAWTWADKRTLQFRPAEPWPALARFAVEATGTSRVLSTMMTAPQAMQPADGSTGLPPFRTLTLTFTQPLDVVALKRMLRLEVRDLPGLSDQPRQQIEDFALALLPRA
ncbi:MAG: hypothetical protein FJ137_08825, partial [Deltaproteobacteria bacterium]|nr:hypothetical protein [Deltaproteobacteria bacterium]